MLLGNIRKFKLLGHPNNFSTLDPPLFITFWYAGVRTVFGFGCIFNFKTE